MWMAGSSCWVAVVGETSRLETAYFTAVAVTRGGVGRITERRKEKKLTAINKEDREVYVSKQPAYP